MQAIGFLLDGFVLLDRESEINAICMLTTNLA